MSRTDSKVGDLSMNSAVLLGSDLLVNGEDILWADNSFHVGRKHNIMPNQDVPGQTSKVAHIQPKDSYVSKRTSY